MKGAGVRGDTLGLQSIEGEVTWPQSSPEQQGQSSRASRAGEGETKALASLYPASWLAAVLGPVALVTRPGQAKAEKPGSMEERGHEPREGGPGEETPSGAEAHNWGGGSKDG